MTQITVTGLVATTPRYIETDYHQIASFRFVDAQKRFDPEISRWIEGDSNWFTVTGFGNLAKNIMESIDKGDRITVTGALKIREWDNGDRSGISVEIEATTIGHDLAYGKSEFTRLNLTLDSKPKENLDPHSCNCVGCQR